VSPLASVVSNDGGVVGRGAKSGSTDSQLLSSALEVDVVGVSHTVAIGRAGSVT
jgi:hypothetical protein